MAVLLFIILHAYLSHVQGGSSIWPSFSSAICKCGMSGLALNLYHASLLACNIVARIIERPPSPTTHYVWWIICVIFKMHQRSFPSTLILCVLDISNFGNLIVNFYVQNLSLLTWLLAVQKWKCHLGFMH